MSDQFTADRMSWLERVQDDPEIGPGAFSMAFAIARHLSREKGEAWPGQKRLAALVGIKERQSRNLIRLLEERGHLVVESGGFQRPDRYRLGSPENASDRQPVAAMPDRQPSAALEPDRQSIAAPDRQSGDIHTGNPLPPNPLIEPFEEIAAAETRAGDLETASAIEGQVLPPMDPAMPSDWPTGDARRHAEILVQEAATVFLDPTRQPGLATTTGRIHAWRRAGASWHHDVLPVVVSIAQKQRRPIATWKFFDGAVAQALADNQAALRLPESPSPKRRLASTDPDVVAYRIHDFAKTGEWKAGWGPHPTANAPTPRPSQRLQAKRENLRRHYAGAEQAAALVAARRDY